MEAKINSCPDTSPKQENKQTNKQTNKHYELTETSIVIISDFIENVKEIETRVGDGNIDDDTEHMDADHDVVLRNPLKP